MKFEIKKLNNVNGLTLKETFLLNSLSEVPSTTLLKSRAYG